MASVKDVDENTLHKGVADQNRIQRNKICPNISDTVAQKHDMIYVDATNKTWNGEYQYTRWQSKTAVSETIMEYSTAIPSIDPRKISHYGAMHVNFTDDDLLFLDENNTSIPTNMLHMQDGDWYVIVCVYIYIHIHIQQTAT